MKSCFSYALPFVVALSVAGCRQADATIPAPQGEVLNRINDLSRDLAAVARGETQAKQDFADDLAVFVKSTEGIKTAMDFGLKVGDTVAGAMLTEQAAQQLAHTSWSVVGVTDLSERQIETLENDLKAQLVALGIPEDRSASVAGQVPEVQRVITTRPRRWYEVF